LREIRDAIPLVDKQTRSLGFTGGEPLLNWRGFMAILRDCRDELPRTAVHVLSNGRAFASTEVVADWTGVQHPSLTVGIPIYSAVDQVHDYVVQANGAFDETVLGILNSRTAASASKFAWCCTPLRLRELSPRVSGWRAICHSWTTSH